MKADVEADFDTVDTHVSDSRWRIFRVSGKISRSQCEVINLLCCGKETSNNQRACTDDDQPPCHFVHQKFLTAQQCQREGWDVYWRISCWCIEAVIDAAQSRLSAAT